MEEREPLLTRIRGNPRVFTAAQWVIARLPVLAAKELLYTSRYFDVTDARQGAVYERLSETLYERYRPATAVDVGCGKGTILAALAGRGVDVAGVEGSRHAINRSPVRDKIVRRNLERPLPPLGRFDLCLCLEVAEHLPARAARVLVGSLTRLSDVVVFTAARPGQGGRLHVNEQPPSYWRQLFDEQGFARDPDDEQFLRGALTGIEGAPYIRANLMVFRSGS